MSLKKQSSRLYAHPFSRDYWLDAFSEFKDLRMLIFAALVVAIRVAMKPLKIPLGPSLDFNTQFFINALGAMTYGPVVALAGAAVSDTLGCLLFPSGPYFFPFIFTEMAGSLIFALFLYRAKLTVKRIVLCRFSVNVLVNLVLQTPIMMLYYQMVLGKSYAVFDFPRIAKNLVLFPLESVLLVFFLRAAVPAMARAGAVRCETGELRMTKKNVALLSVLTAVSLLATGGYMIYSYNTTSLSASYSAEERLARNEEMNALVLAQHPEMEPEETVSIIESAYPHFGSAQVTYTVAVYRADRAAVEAEAENAEEAWKKVRGYSKSKAKNDPALTLVERAEIVTEKGKTEPVSYTRTE